MEHSAINGYVLKHKLGNGGTAEVWYAENDLQQAAAVKILYTKFCNDPDAIARFENEAKLMIQLKHPHIRNILYYGLLGERPCMVMEYLEGMDLSKRMKNGEKFTSHQLSLWWNDLVDTLQYTHTKNIIHRDIKPSNLFVTEFGQIKLLDFGVAKIKEHSMVTQTGSRMGTLMYMSPEQVYDLKSLTYKTDVYSLAVTFYHLVTGAAPYDSTHVSDYEIQENIVRKNIDTSFLPSTWNKLLPTYLHKNADERSELVKISDHYITDDSIGETIYIDPETATHSIPLAVPPKPPVLPDVRPRVHQSYNKRSSLFSFLLPVSIVLLLVVFVLKKDQWLPSLSTNSNSIPKETSWQKQETTKKTSPPAAVVDSVAEVTDAIISEGVNQSDDEVTVDAQPIQKEAELKIFINDYYRSRSNCRNLSHFFNDVVLQYYSKSNVPLSIIEKECKSYHDKWKFTDADIDSSSYTFTHSQAKVYVDFTIMYYIKQYESDAWIPYKIDVAMVIDETNKIERIVERRIEKL